MAIGDEAVAQAIATLSEPMFKHVYDDLQWLNEPEKLEDGVEARGVRIYLRERNGTTFFDRHKQSPNLFRVYKPSSCVGSQIWCPSSIQRVTLRKRGLFRPAKEASRMVCLRCDKVLGIPVGVDLPDPNKQGALSVAECGGLSVIGESK